MAVLFTTTTGGSGAGSLSITLAGVTLGDLLILAHYSRSSGGASAPVYESDQSDAGFTSHGSVVDGGGSFYLWSKVAVAADVGAPEYTVALISSVSKQCMAALVEDTHDGLDGTPAFLSNVADTTPDSPSITTGRDGATVYRMLGMIGNGTALVSYPANTTALFDIGDQPGGGLRLAGAWHTQALAGATGVATWAISVAQNSHGLTFAVRAPEPEPPSTDAHGIGTAGVVSSAAGVAASGAAALGLPATAVPTGGTPGLEPSTTIRWV